MMNKILIQAIYPHLNGGAKNALGIFYMVQMNSYKYLDMGLALKKMLFVYSQKFNFDRFVPFAEVAIYHAVADLFRWEDLNERENFIKSLHLPINQIAQRFPNLINDVNETTWELSNHNDNIVDAVRETLGIKKDPSLTIINNNDFFRLFHHAYWDLYGGRSDLSHSFLSSGDLVDLMYQLAVKQVYSIYGA